MPSLKWDPRCAVCDVEKTPAPQPTPTPAPAPSDSLCRACSMSSVRWDPRCAMCEQEKIAKDWGVFKRPVYVLVSKIVPDVAVGVGGGQRCKASVAWYDVRSCEELNYLAWAYWKYGAPHDENACTGTEILRTTYTPPAGWDLQAPRFMDRRLYTLPVFGVVGKRIEVELPPIVTPKDYKHVPPPPDWYNPSPICDPTPDWYLDKPTSPYDFGLTSDYEPDDVGYSEI